MRKFMILSAVLLLSQLIAQSSTQNSTLKEAQESFGLKNYDQAALSFEYLAQNDPDNPEFKSALALCYKRSGQFDKARKSYEALIIQEEVNPEVLFEYADLLKSNAEYAEAKKYYLEYARHNPVIGSYFAGLCDQLSSGKNPLSNLEEPHERVSAETQASLPVSVQEPVTEEQSPASNLTTKGSAAFVQENLVQQSFEQSHAEKNAVTNPSANDIQKPLQTSKLYFIQLTSLTKYSNRMDEKFAKFATYGDIYKVQVDGAMKIRIGAFNDINEAIAVMKLVKKNDFKDAFIVSDVIDQERTVLLARSSSGASTPKELPKTETTPTENPNADKQDQVSTATDDSEEGKYKIRVSEYKAPDWFDVSKINDLGNIEHWTKSGLTIIVLGSYKTEDSAKKILKKLKSRGFKDAYLVVEDNGKLYRL